MLDSEASESNHDKYSANQIRGCDGFGKEDRRPPGPSQYAGKTGHNEYFPDDRYDMGLVRKVETALLVGDFDRQLKGLRWVTDPLPIRHQASDRQGARDADMALAFG